MGLLFSITGKEFVVEANYIVSLLNSKEQDVIKKRYGFGDSDKQTLAQVGEFYGISRERVRQIQNSAFKKLRRNYGAGKLSPMVEDFVEYVKANGGVIEEDKAVEWLQDKYPFVKDGLNELIFVLEISDQLVHEHNRVNFAPVFRMTKYSMTEIIQFSSKVIDYLKSYGKVLDLSYVLKSLQTNFSSKTVRALLNMDRRVILKEGEVSLTEWRHINPRTLFDKIQYVLNLKKEPMHFGDVAKLVEEFKFDEKPVSTHAIHNELINNPEFVLIGRGIYASKEWGYKKGTVNEVIASILEKKGPMHLYDITQEVLQRRKVKPVTVQMNLNAAKNKFRKNSLGQYELI